MPVTGLRLPNNKGGFTNVHVITAPLDVIVDGEQQYKISVSFNECDEDFKHTGRADVTTDIRDEETFHRGLRAAAAEEGQLITSQSTNPEWNPEGYTKNYDK